MFDQRQLLSLEMEWYINHPYYKYSDAMTLINNSKNMIDLGSGEKPHPKAKTAVDKFIEPVQRAYGARDRVDPQLLEKRGIRFVESDISSMPFDDKEFDVAYSHHVIEHVDDPMQACKEIMRIAQSGVFFAPSPFAEIAFGRPYHKWMVSAKQNTLIFVEKDEVEYQPFGRRREDNPFEIALNWGQWFKYPIAIKNFRELVRKYFYTHHPVIETIFIWHDKFSVCVIWKNGDIQSF